MINGIQKLSLVDYPETPSFVIFLGGCNMRCPFCHNKSIVDKTNEEYKIDHVLNLINDRKKFVSGIVVTGGEPTIYGNKLIELLKQLKKSNLKIKLDTNGTNPKLIQSIIDLDLINYIAMDLKNTFAKYNETSGTNINIDDINQSIQIIENSNINYEFRTTVNKDMHSLKDIKEISSYFKDISKFYLQPYKYNENQVTDIKYTEYSKEELTDIQKQIYCKIKV